MSDPVLSSISLKKKVTKKDHKKLPADFQRLLFDCEPLSPETPDTSDSDESLLNTILVDVYEQLDDIELDSDDHYKI